MKRKITFLSAALMLLAFLAFPLGMWGQTRTEITWTASEQGYTNGQSLNGISIELDDNITIQFDKNDVNATAPKYYNTGSAARLYPKNSLTVTPASGYQITGMTLTFSGTSYTGTLGASAGTYSLSSTTGTWTGSSTDAIVLTNNATSSHARLQVLAVTYTEGGSTPTPTYTVTYNANGGTGEMTDPNSPYEESDPVTLLTNTFTAPEGKMWDSWLVKDADDNTITVTNNQFTMPASNVTVTAQWVVDPSAPQYEWVLTDWADLTGDDIFVIVGNDSKAMANEASTSNPSAVAVTIQNGKITTDVTDNMKWNRVAVDGGYKLLPNGSTTTWLNNPSGTGLRIDDATSNNVFTYVAYSSNNYLKVGDRYACIYNNNDWRAYATSSVSSNATNTTFYRRQLVSTDPTINASNVNIAYDATSGTINYTIDNPDPDATMQAEVADGATITNLVLGTPGADAVSFTCDANSSTTTTLTAEVTLNYVKNDDVLATKSVTITQAVAPVIYSTIPDLFAAATSTETEVLVTFNNWVVSGVSTNGKNVFVTDNNGNGFVMYFGSDMSSTYAAGKVLAGNAVSCSLKLYNGFAELLNVDASDLTIADGGIVTVANIDMADLAGVNTGALVHYDNLTCSVNNNKYYLSDGTTTLQVYNSLYAFGSTLVAEHIYNITGVYQQFNSTKEVLPRSAADIEEVTAPVVPSITVDPDEINVDGVSQDGYLTIDYDNLDIQSAEDFTIQFYDDNNQTIEKPNWMLEANVTTQVGEEGYFVYYMVGTNEDQIRTAHFKVKVSDTYSNLVTLTQAKVVPFINLLAVNDGDDSYLINYTSEASGGYPDKIQHGYFSATSGANSFHIQYCDNNGTAIDVTPEWIEQVTVVDAPSWISSTYALYVSVFANEGSARSAYFKVWALDNDSNPVYSELVTLNQAAVDYATLPFEFDGGRADIATTAGLTQEGLESDYASAPKLKFNGTGDYVLLKINERPGTLTFDIKGYTFSGGTFTVQTSEDGTTFTDLENYTDANFGNTLQSEEFNNLGENVRYIKWIYTEKSNGNVALGNIKLAKYVEPVVVASITVDPALVDAPAEGVEGTLTVTYENITTVDADVWFCDAAGTTTATYNWITADINAQNNVEYLVKSNNGEARTAYLKVYALDDNGDDVYSNLVTVTQAAAPAMALYTYFINGVEDQDTHVAAVGTPVTLAAGENLNNNFTFAGWSTDPNDVENRITEYTFNENEVVTFYAVYAHTVTGEPTETVVILDGSGLTSTATTQPSSYTNNGFNYMLSAGAKVQTSTGDNRFADKAVLIGKSGAYIYNTSVFGQGITKFEVYSSNAASTNVSVGINFSANAINEYDATAENTWTATLNQQNHVYDASEALPQGANAKYFWYQVTNNYNSQVQFRITYTSTSSNTTYYTRVFLENPTTPVVIAGPSIVPSGYTLDASSVGLNNSLDASKLIIEDGAQLKTPNAVFATVEKNITGYGEANFQTNQGYYLVSAPAATYLYVDSNNGNVDAYMFDASEQGEEWRNFKLAGGAWHIAAGNAVLYASKNDCTLSLDGYGIVYNTPYPGANVVYNKVPATNANIEIDVQFNGGKTFEGFNLIGNPFTCTAYLADGRDFYRMNAAGDAIVLADETNGGNAISVCEGIFVVTTSGEYNVAFTTTEPATSTSGNSNAMLNLSITQNRGSLVDNARIRFGEGNAMPKMVFGDNSRIFFTQGTKDYAVVRSNAEGEMPVSFKAENNGSYTISVNAENVEMNYLHLIDNLTGADIDLLATPSYSFEAKTTDYASRFRLVFNANTVTENSNEAFAYYNGSEWVINNMGEATLQVVDVMGRVLSAETVSGNATMNTSSLSAGIYMMRLVKGEDVKVQKIVVR